MSRSSVQMAGESDTMRHEPSAESPVEGQHDQELVDRFRAGDATAFDDIVRAHGDRLLAVARRYLPEEADALDAVQDAFVSAFKAMPEFEGTSRLTTWLHRITVNACLMKLRSRRRRPEVSIEQLLPEFLADGHHRNPPLPWKPEARSGIEREEVRALVRSMIDELPETYRVILILRDIDELNTEETAAVLGLSLSAVKTRLHRARQALRTLLEPHFAEGVS